VRCGSWKPYATPPIAIKGLTVVLWPSHRATASEFGIYPVDFFFSNEVEDFGKEGVDLCRR